jgi:hypothetical protein
MALAAHNGYQNSRRRHFVNAAFRQMLVAVSIKHNGGEFPFDIPGPEWLIVLTGVE